MRILTIPAISGGESHLIPLFVLHQRYLRRIESIDNHFLLPKEKVGLFTQKNIKAVDVAYNIEGSQTSSYLEIGRALFDLEREAYNKIKPHIIIEDNCFGSPLIAERMGIPRISIHRTGFFRSIDPGLRIPNHCHSVEKGEGFKRAANVMDFLSRKNWTTSPSKEEDFLRNYLKAKTKLVPGIRSIEVLPLELRKDDSYFFCGPLLVEDSPSDELLRQLDSFFKANQHKRKAFITTGLIDKSSITSHIDYLLKRNYAVITTLKHDIKPGYSNSYIYNSFLPLNLICSKVDIFIHQCGNGIYHYPILNEKPSITLGTQCYDREDVALRLQQVGVSKHIPHPEDDKNYLELFATSIEQFENGTLTNFSVLTNLKREVYETMLGFNAQDMIDFTLSRQKN